MRTLLLPMMLIGLVSCKDSKQDATEHRANVSEHPAQAESASSGSVSESLSPTQLEITAAKGDARAAAILSIKYMMGDGVIVDETKGITFAVTAANTESPFGWFALSEALSAGRGIAKNEARAAALFEKALPGLKQLAGRNDPWAQFALGVAYEDGKGVTKDAKKSAEWYEKAATQGLAIAQNSLGVATDDQKRAFEWYEKAAAQSNAPAFVNLGIALEQGQGTPKDEQKAAAYYQKAADRNESTGQLMLGAMYSSGIGVTMDKQKAVELYTRAAEHGLAAAQTSLGVMYSTGTGVLEDKRKAVEWFQKAAAQGDANGQVNLAFAYEVGAGVAINQEQAADWYEKAALLGDAEAELRMGGIYADGRGRAKDETKSLEWFTKAAAQGNPEAEYVLGFKYRNGSGVAKDEQTAVEWFKKAAAHGSSDAQKQLGVNPPAIPIVLMDRKKMIEHLVIVEGNAGLGSGSIIRLKGNSLIVTNAHVLSGNDKVSFRLINSTALNVGTLGIARGCDLAVAAQTTVEGGLEAMQEVEKNVNIGDAVVVLGNSQGSGVVTEIFGKVTGIGPELVEVDAKFVAGNSGSPILHMKSGKVIAIATFATLRKLDTLTKDSKFTEIRRFGYRLDTVPQWEFRDWDAFSREAKMVAEVEHNSENLIRLVRDIYANGHVTGHLHQDASNRLRRYIADYVSVMDAPPRPVPTPRPVIASEIDATFRGQPLPGESAKDFMARRTKLGASGALGPIGLPANGNERAAGTRQAEQVRSRLVRDAVQQAEEDARVGAEAQRKEEQSRVAAAYLEAKRRFLRGIANEATADVKALNLETFTDYHKKKLRGEIELREMLKREFEKLSAIQDSGHEIRLP